MKRVMGIGAVPVATMLLTFGCGGSDGSSSSPTAPTAAVPAGCSGSAVPQVEVSFTATLGEGINVQLFGETFNRRIAVGEIFKVTRSVVPCDYEITGQMLGRNLAVGFARTPPFENRGPGVEKGSVVIVEGPNGVFGPVETACSVRFNATGGPNQPPPPPPFNIKIRFRVSNSNAVDDRGGGCG